MYLQMKVHLARVIWRADRNEMGELLEPARQSHYGAPPLRQNWNSLFFGLAQMAYRKVYGTPFALFQFCRRVARRNDCPLTVARRLQKFAHLIRIATVPPSLQGEATQRG